MIMRGLLGCRLKQNRLCRAVLIARRGVARNEVKLGSRAMKESRDALQVGTVKFQAVLGDINDLQADALVQPSGTSLPEQPMQASPWVIEADHDGSISQALRVHRPFQLGDVLITPAGTLKAKYLFNAVVIDWGHQRSPHELLSPDVVVSTARKCIEVAAALGIKSIAFTPWGTRVGATEASQVTALLVQAIASAVQVRAGNLEVVYLISKNTEHYQWFLDRAFVFRVMFEQVDQLRQEIERLNLSERDNRQLQKLLGNLRHNLATTVNVFLGQSQLVARCASVFQALRG